MSRRLTFIRRRIFPELCVVLELASAEMYSVQLTSCRGVSNCATASSRPLCPGGHGSPRDAGPPLREPGWTESLPLMVFLVSLLLFGMARVDESFRRVLRG